MPGEELRMKQTTEGEVIEMGGKKGSHQPPPNLEGRRLLVSAHVQAYLKMI